MLGWMTVSLLALASPALADSHESDTQSGHATHGKSGKMDPTPEARAKMADAHQRMADCLRSTRPMKECKAEMKKACEGMHGAEGCSMGHHEMHHAPSDAQKAKPKTE
jgi:hypothetical protein